MLSLLLAIFTEEFAIRGTQWLTTTIAPNVATAGSLTVSYHFRTETRPDMIIETTSQRAIREFEFENEDKKADLILFYVGLVIYWAQCVEKTLENMLITKELSANSKLNNKIIDETFDRIENSKSTMGKLVADVKKTFSINDEHSEKLKAILDLRNYFAHKFFKVNSFKPYTENGQREMILECAEFIDECKALDKELVIYSTKYELKMGLTEELTNETFRQARQEEYDKEKR